MMTNRTTDVKSLWYLYLLFIFVNDPFEILILQLQQEEEELIRKRAANSTALAAIGPRKKRKLDEALEGSSSSSTPVSI